MSGEMRHQDVTKHERIEGPGSRGACAYHEAGHAALAARLRSRPFKYVTIARRVFREADVRPDGYATMGQVVYDHELLRPLRGMRCRETALVGAMINEILVCLAGPVAEARYLGISVIDGIAPRGLALQGSPEDFIASVREVGFPALYGSLGDFIEADALGQQIAEKVGMEYTHLPAPFLPSVEAAFADPAMWSAVSQVASLLRARGRVWYRRVRTIVKAARTSEWGSPSDPLAWRWWLSAVSGNHIGRARRRGEPAARTGPESAGQAMPGDA